MRIKGISRIDSTHKRQHAWLARHYTEGETITKQFTDSKYGGKRQALAAARAWLAQQRKERPSRPRPEELAPFQRQKVRSNTGIMGISRTYDYARHDRSVKLENFSVAYSERGVRGNKKFYIHHYADEREALAEAIKFRREKEREMLAEWRQRQARLLANGRPKTGSDRA